MHFGKVIGSSIADLTMETVNVDGTLGRDRMIGHHSEGTGSQDERSRTTRD